MKYIVTHDLRGGLIVSTGTQLEIDQFTFLADSAGQLADRIQTEVDAGTKEEAYRKARRLFAHFLSKLTLVDSGEYALLDSYSIEEAGKITGERVAPASASLGRDGNIIKQDFEKNIKDRHLPVGPLTHYSDGINSSDPFVKYREFYKVLEFYLGGTGKITGWIRTKKPGIKMEKGQRGEDITIISWIRHKLSHPEKVLEPFSISNPQHVELVQNYVLVVQDLAREIIREKESV